MNRKASTIIFGPKYSEASKVFLKRYTKEQIEDLSHYDIKEILEEIQRQINDSKN